ncbi:hypothetical protein BH18ACT11_BH18ACT11_08690 [soil metagenome]
MPDDRRFSEEEIERGLRDLGARVEYPPTPDVARAVRLRLDEERNRQTRRAWHWPPFLAPRWTAVAAALVLISVIALSPTVRTTLSDFLAPGDQTSSEAGGPVARPESGGSDRFKQEAGEGEGAVGCPAPSIEAEPARGAAGARFRLSGHDFSSGCDGATPASGVRIYFLQAGRTWKLTTLDAGPGLTFDTRLRVPAGADPGRATVRATMRSGERVERRFVVLR